MKSMSFKILCGVALFASVMFTGCSKDGAAGPAGEDGATGPAGPAGPSGPAGATGATGTTGTANVIYSAWANRTFAVSSTNSKVIFSNITAPQLTVAALGTSTVHVYANVGTTAAPTVVTVDLVNLTTILLTNTIQLQTQYASTVSDADVIAEAADYSTLPIRYVIIPGGTAAGRVDIDWKNYADVKAKLGLKD